LGVMPMLAVLSIVAFDAIIARQRQAAALPQGQD